MKLKNKIFTVIVFVLIVINVKHYIIPYFSTSEKDLTNVKSEVALNSDDLVFSYINNEEISNNLYAGKVIEVEGFVKEVTFLNERNTVLLYTKNKKSGIICDVHSSQKEKIKKLTKNQKIRIKGICKGFLKDVILLNCYIDLKPNE